MNAAAPGESARDRRLRALGVARLRLRGMSVVDAPAPAERVVTPVAAVALPTVPAPTPVATAPASVIRRLALQADPAERHDPAVDKMYTALTEAVSKAGLQPVRVCDVAADPGAAVMVFGAAPVPDGVPLMRVLRADPLTVLHADRERKRRLWEQLQALGGGVN